MRPLVSTHFPYLLIKLKLRGRTETVEALLDTGFDGDVAVPLSSLSNGEPPDYYVSCRLANDLEVEAPVYLGEARLETRKLSPIAITSLGDEPLIGRGITNHFTITLDHGKRLVVEP